MQIRGYMLEGKGCDGIELDIQVTKDHRVIVFHDPDSKRVTGVDKVVKNSNYSDLLSLNVGLRSFNASIPLLSEVLEKMPANKIIQIEIKPQIENMDVVISALSAMRRDIKAQILSSDPKKLKKICEEIPYLDCFLGADYDNPAITDRILFSIEHGFTGMTLNYQLATKVYVDEAVNNGLQIGAWTVNDIEVAKCLIKNGVRFITGDFVDQFLHLKQTKEHH